MNLYPILLQFSFLKIYLCEPSLNQSPFTMVSFLSIYSHAIDVNGAIVRKCFITVLELDLDTGPRYETGLQYYIIMWDPVDIEL